jgi:hypothetical protein
MNFDFTKQEADAILNALQGSPLKCEKSLRERLIRVFVCRLYPSKAPDTNGWAPMKKSPTRSNWPRTKVKPDGKSHWSYHKPRAKKVQTSTKPTKKQLTADEILAML